MKVSRSIEQNMFYGAKPDIFQKATELRRNETEAEKKLWEYLKENQLAGFKFRRQHPIDIFIVDFYCHKVKLVIELDGGIHMKEETREYDKGRESELMNFDLKILRFTNNDVVNNIDNVIFKIKAYLLNLRADSL